MAAVKALTLRIPVELYERVRLAAFREHLPVSKVIAKILDEALPGENE
jgi:hypothetical protein